MSAAPTVSRRTFLGYSFSAGVLLIGTRLVPGELVGGELVSVGDPDL